MPLSLNSRGKEAMKKIIKLIPLILSFSLILGFASCVNAAAGSASSDKTVIFRGSFSIDESYITQDSNSVMASRSAQPTIPAEANLTYYAKATNGSQTLTSQDIDNKLFEDILIVIFSYIFLISDKKFCLISFVNF